MRQDLQPDPIFMALRRAVAGPLRRLDRWLEARAERRAGRSADRLPQPRDAGVSASPKPDLVRADR